MLLCLEHHFVHKKEKLEKFHPKNRKKYDSSKLTPRTNVPIKSSKRLSHVYGVVAKYCFVSEGLKIAASSTTLKNSHVCVMYTNTSRYWMVFITETLKTDVFKQLFNELDLYKTYQISCGDVWLAVCVSIFVAGMKYWIQQCYLHDLHCSLKLLETSKTVHRDIVWCTLLVWRASYWGKI